MSMSNFRLSLLNAPQTEITEKWNELYFIDVFTDCVRGVAVRRVDTRSTMHANDLCFCGSGIKHKKCHPTINENSVIANLLRVSSN